MLKKLKALLCKLLGHRSILILAHNNKSLNGKWVSSFSIYECERCETRREEKIEMSLE